MSQYEGRKLNDFTRDARKPIQPTAALPRTEEKVAEMAARAARREELFHTDDATGTDDHHLLWELAKNRARVIVGVQEPEEKGSLVPRGSLAEKIRKHRESKGLSRKQLATRAGITPNYLGKLERNRKKPSVGVLWALCDVFGVSIDGFLGRTKYPTCG